jgi:hypothetical protein
MAGPPIGTAKQVFKIPADIKEWTVTKGLPGISGWAWERCCGSRARPSRCDGLERRPTPPGHAGR